MSSYPESPSRDAARGRATAEASSLLGPARHCLRIAAPWSWSCYNYQPNLLLWPIFHTIVASYVLHIIAYQRSTNPQRWPLNVSPPSSPTLRPARARWTRCKSNPRSDEMLEHVLMRWEQHLAEPRRYRYHPRDPHSSHQGQEGRSQGYAARWHCVQDLGAGREEEQFGPPDGGGYLLGKCTSRNGEDAEERLLI